MDLARTILLLASILGIAWWAGTVMKAEGEDKLVEACHPVELATSSLINVTNALVGYPPKWTFGTKRIMDGSCYYFFGSLLFSNPSEAAESSRPGGGVRSGNSVGSNVRDQ